MKCILAEHTEDVATCRTRPHGCRLIHHHSTATQLAGTVHDVVHGIEGGLEEEAVIAAKQVLAHQMLYLSSTN